VWGTKQKKGGGGERGLLVANAPMCYVHPVVRSISILEVRYLCVTAVLSASEALTPGRPPPAPHQAACGPRPSRPRRAGCGVCLVAHNLSSEYPCAVRWLVPSKSVAATAALPIWQPVGSTCPTAV
jgi:hypothetical protein